jgi:hypothetical protein
LVVGCWLVVVSCWLLIEFVQLPRLLLCQTEIKVK